MGGPEWGVDLELGLGKPPGEGRRVEAQSENPVIDQGARARKQVGWPEEKEKQKAERNGK